jgi:hypothetical protein
MPAPDDPQVTLVRVGGGTSRVARTWIAVLAIAVASAAIVGVGLLGGTITPSPRPVPSRAAAQEDATPSPAASRGVRPSPGGSARVARVIAPPNAGYEVDYARDGSHRPIVTQNGALAIFGFGERVPDGTYPGVISVAVGTPARGASIPFEGQSRFVYGRTLDELAASYFGGEDQVPVVRSAFGVDRTLGLLLDFDAPAPGAPTRSVALLVAGNRAYVIESVGFDGMFPGLRNAASAGLVRFLAGFRFGDPLYVSAPALGYQAVPPEGMDAESAPGDSVIFTDRTTGSGFARSISIAVWVPQRGAVPRLLTPIGERQDDVVWAGSAADVEENYVSSRPGPVVSRGPIRVGGLVGQLVEQEGEPATVFVVRGDRTFVISWAATPPGSGLDEFGAFLETVAFFDP